MKSFTISIIILSFVAAGMELLMPGQAFKKYGKTVMGIVMIMAIINPIMSIFNTDFNLNSFDETKNSINYSESFDSSVTDEFKTRLSQKLSAMFPGSNIESKFDIVRSGAGYKILGVKVKTDGNFNDIKKALTNEFGVEEDAIIGY